MSTTNTITAYIRAGQNEVTVTRPLTQYDYGQVLLFDGIELPEAYEVVFGNDEQYGAVGKSRIGNSEGVSIPDEFLATGLPVYAWLFLHEAANDGRTVYKIKIPVRKRAEDATNPPTEEEISTVTQAIAALNAAVSKSEDNVSHYPVITNDYWHVWDADNGEYVNTGVKASGTDGAKGDKGDTGDTGQNGKDPFFIYGTITYNHSNYELTTVQITTTRDEIVSAWSVTNPPVALVLTHTSGGHTDYLIFECTVSDITSNMITFERLVMDGNPLIYLESVLVVISSNSVVTEYDRQMYEKAHTTVDIVQDSLRTYENGMTTFTVTHTKANCDSYLIGLTNTRETNIMYAWIKSSNTNTAVIDVANNGDTVTKRLFSMVWLCIPNSGDEEVIAGDMPEP